MSVVRGPALLLRGALYGALGLLLLMPVTGKPQRGAPVQGTRRPVCRRAVIQGAVHLGQGFQIEFARGMVFGLEPIHSGWALRIVAADKARGPHDYAEVATLPYQSVSPLLLSTDWAFRAQDAVGWTPRRFRYAGSEAAYQSLSAGYEAVLRGDTASARRAAVLAESQPEGLLEIEDAKIAPGAADQARMAAAISSRFTQTPHTVDGNAPSSPLGSLEDIRFRVSLDLSPAMTALPGAKIVPAVCPVRPTAVMAPASQSLSKPKPSLTTSGALPRPERILSP